MIAGVTFDTNIAGACCTPSAIVQGDRAVAGGSKGRVIHGLSPSKDMRWVIVARRAVTCHGVVNQCSSRLGVGPMRSTTANSPGAASGCQNPVPRVAVKIDRLRAIGDEGQRRAGGALMVGRDDHQKRVLVQGDECLRAVGVTLDHVEA